MQRLIRPRARVVGVAHLPQGRLGRRARRVLRCDRLLAYGDQPLAFVAPGQDPLGAALADLAHLPPSGEQHAPGARRGDPGEPLRDIPQSLDHPRVAEQPPREPERRTGPAHQLDQPDGARRRRRTLLWPQALTRALSRVRAQTVARAGAGARARLARRVLGAIPRQQRARPVGTRPVQERVRRAQVAHQRRIQATAQRSGERQLVAVAHFQRLAQRARSSHPGAAIAGVAAQELVGRGQLGAHPRGLSPGSLRGGFRAAQPGARLLGQDVGLRARFAHRLARFGELARELCSPLALGAQPLDLALHLTLALALELSQLSLQAAHAVLARRRALLRLLARGACQSRLGGRERAQLALDTARALAQRRRACLRLLAAQLQALAR